MCISPVIGISPVVGRAIVGIPACLTSYAYYGCGHLLQVWLGVLITLEP